MSLVPLLLCALHFFGAFHLIHFSARSLVFLVGLLQEKENVVSSAVEEFDMTIWYNLSFRGCRIWR